MTELGENLRTLRELRGLTQAELGTKAGMGGASVSHFETGQRMPSLESLIRLADALNVTTDALLGRSSIKSAPTVDPIFLRAAHADAQTLDAIRRVTEALLSDSKARK